MRKLLSGLALSLLIAVGLTWWLSRPAVPDAFYLSDTIPTAPGTLIRSEIFTRGVPDGARGWRLLYATTRANGKAAIASALLVVPAQTNAAPFPVIAWAHGTTGVAQGCAPSLLAKPFNLVPAFDQVTAQGWAFVATDYVGLGTTGGHAYLIGEESARATLDAVRAASQMQDVKMSNQFVVWGHSQGGHTSLWTGMRAASYAPELNLQGIAAFAPATDLPALAASLQSNVFGKIVSAFFLESYSKAYPDIRPQAYASFWQNLVGREIASRCTAGIETLFSAGLTLLLPSTGLFAQDPNTGPFGRHLAANTPDEPIPVPLFIAQGAADDLIRPEIQDKYVRDRCAAGQSLFYKHYETRDHVTLVNEDTPLAADLLAWTKDRFESQPAPDNCKDF